MLKNQPLNNSVVIYCRVSTDKQDKSGLGLEAQLQICRETCERLGLTVLAEFKEQISGKVHPQDRPIFSQAAQLAIKNKSSIMVAKLDRLSREVYHISGYTQHYIYGKNTPQLIVADTPNMSQLEIYIKAMISEEERKLIGKRTREALAVLKNQGRELGKAGREAAHKAYTEANKEAVERAIALRIEGYSYNLIAQILNSEGFTTSKGGSWYPAEIRKRMITYQNKTG